MSYKPNPIKQLFHNTRRFLAMAWLAYMPVFQIAITGSQGKTNTSSTLFHILSSFAPTVRTDIDLDTIYNVPITALKINPQTKYAIFELGIDHVNEMDEHLEIVTPKMVIITGVSPVHADAEHLGSFQNVIREKQKLVESLDDTGVAILNGDDEQVRAMATHTKAKVIYFGKNENNDIRATEMYLSTTGTQFFISYKRTGGEPLSFMVELPLIGLHHVYNVMASFAAYISLGFTDIGQFRTILKSLHPLPGRMSLEKGPFETLLLDDSLRANPASTVSGLQTLSKIDYKDGRKIAILAEMGELEHPEDEHKKIGELLNNLKIDFVILIGPLHENAFQAAITGGFPKGNIFLSKTVIDAAEILKTYVKKNDLIYLKGSLLRKIRRIIMILEGVKVGCDIVVCPFYHLCPGCKFLESGYKSTE